MRKIIDVQPCFFLNLFKEGKIVISFREKYDKIDMLLDNHPEILNTFHSDLSNFCSSEERETNFSSEQILRMIIVKGIEELPYRKCIICIAGSDFVSRDVAFVALY